MRTIIVMRGIPGSGKSTYAKSLLAQEPNRFKRINRDDLRAMLDGGFFGDSDREHFVTTVQDAATKAALREGYDVILDNTNIVPSVVKKTHKLAESIGDVKVIEKCFNISIEECLARNALRTGQARVPDKVIHDMARTAGIDKGHLLQDKEVYYPSHASSSAGYVQDVRLPRAILCDLDGTLALLNGRNPYDASTCDQDLPNTPVIECVKAMYLRGYQIIFMSGREDKYREPTIQFIEQHCYAMCPITTSDGMTLENRLIDYELHMRASGDQRKDSVVKRELFDAHVAGKYFVEFVLDDRDQVVREWRNMGLTVFQVNEGDF